MSKRKVVLNFPPHLIDLPMTYRLIRDYDLTVNILRAHIAPNEWGRMVLDVSGRAEDLARGLAYLAESGVGVEPLDKEVSWLAERCIHCTACIAPCPTHALALERRSMLVSFDRELCIACELCLNVCAYQAIDIAF